ncbi:MAG: hypothetical protein WDN23_21390 [Edaphobacter sp.]
MMSTAQVEARRWLMSAVALASVSVLMGGLVASAQTAGVPAASAGVVLDRVVAVVNGDVILESDMDEERRFEEIQPFRSAAESTRGEDPWATGGSGADFAAGGAGAGGHGFGQGAGYSACDNQEGYTGLQGAVSLRDG